MSALDHIPRWSPVVQLRAFLPGLMLAGVVALAANALALRYGAPVMLFALLIGMALNFLSETENVTAGLEFAASGLLKLGVGLLGLTVPMAAFTALGWPVAIKITGLIAMTLGLSLLLGRRLGMDRTSSLVAGGAVAICGASAALALSTVLPRAARQSTMATVAIATALSSMAMILYPLILHEIGAGDVFSGFVIGASIHDVAQVIGAGYSVSDATGDSATLVKMLRVAHLPLVLLALALVFRGDGGTSQVVLPWFMGLFVVLFLVASLFTIPQTATDAIYRLTRICFATAIAAIGLRADLRSAMRTGPKLLILMGSLTAVLLAGAMGLAILSGMDSVQ